ncbi:MAG TPA: hypothetical protein VFD70_24895 [Anaerolineae bacterium]|nr:hypothetical protein [Anaerolineae bacterium]
MKGYIYISRVFKTIKRAECGGGEDWLDNDPHFWKYPPTWGICRTDYRRRVNEGDYVFFVLPKAAKLPQMVYGYFQVREIITHEQAFSHPQLRSKQMGNKNPNGNIIVDANGHYNRFDGGVHRDRFSEIKTYYVIGDNKESEFLTERKIKKLAPDFVDALNGIFDSNQDSVFGVLTRKGRKMSEDQVRRLLAWLQN